MLRGLIVGEGRHHRRAHLYIMNDTDKFIKRLSVMMMMMTKTTHYDVVVVVIVVEAVRVNRVELLCSDLNMCVKRPQPTKGIIVVVPPT